MFLSFLRHAPNSAPPAPCFAFPSPSPYRRDKWSGSSRQPRSKKTKTIVDPSTVAALYVIFIPCLRIRSTIHDYCSKLYRRRSTHMQASLWGQSHRRCDLIGPQIIIILIGVLLDASSSSSSSLPSLPLLQTHFLLHILQ